MAAPLLAILQKGGRRDAPAALLDEKWLSSDDALKDSFPCVPNAQSDLPENCSSLMLSFGGAASVAAFCRPSVALSAVGCMLLFFHWSVHYDDFFRVEDEASAKHSSLCVEVILLYSWLGDASCTVSLLRCVLAESRKASWEMYEL